MGPVHDDMGRVEREYRRIIDVMGVQSNHLILQWLYSVYQERFRPLDLVGDFDMNYI
jgi:hypothetical protein